MKFLGRWKWTIAALAGLAVLSFALSAGGWWLAHRMPWWAYSMLTAVIAVCVALRAMQLMVRKRAR